MLPIDVKYRLSSTEISKCDEPFDKDIFDAVLVSCNVIREEVHKQAGENIKRAQEKQQRDYAKRNISSVSNHICIGAQVLLRNNKRNNRKGGKFCFKWIGPYVVSDITKRGLVTLKNKDDKELKKKFNKAQLKPFSRNLDVINEFQKLSGGENNEGVNEVIQNNIKNTMENSKILDEKPAKIFHSNSQIQDEKPPRVINYWDKLPDEIIEKLLLESIKNSDYMRKTYNNVLNTCTRFQMVKRIGEKLLPRIYIREDDAVKKSSFNGKFKVSVHKLIKLFGQGSGLIKRVAELIRDKHWKSAWLILMPDKCSWYTIQRIYWRNTLKEKKDSFVNNNLETDSNQRDGFWLRNENFYLKVEDKNILLSSNVWLNDKIMDASQILICKALGTQDYQSVLNCQKRVKPYRAVTVEYIQLLHNGINHWFLSFCSNSRVQVCNSLNSTLTRTSRKSIQSLYKNVGQKNDSGNVRVTFLPVQKQPDGHNCGLFAVAFAAEILAGKSPIEAVFDVAQMRDHLIFCLEQGALTPFLKV